MRADIVQLVALANPKTKAEWRVKFEVWSSWEQRKLALKEMELNEKEALKEALEEYFQTNLEFDDQLTNIWRLFSRMNHAAS